MPAPDLLTLALDGCLRSVPGVRDGHWQDATARTGCSVVLLPEGTVGGVDVRGGAPGSRELALLDPTAMQPHVDAFVLTGGSAPGLACADGVAAALGEAGRGFPTDHGTIPLVPAATLFDLGCGAPRSPGPDQGRAACAAALTAHDDPPPVARGRRGAGCGARIGKVRGHDHAEDGGLGQAGLVLDDGLAVGAIAAVNAYGDVRDPRDGRLLAGARDDDGALLDSARFLIEGRAPAVGFSGGNTVLVAVVTNARMTKAEATRLARMAQAGMARSLSPCATSLDGDIVFAGATGTHEAGADRVGSLAAEVVAAAVLDAVGHDRPGPTR